MHDSRTQAAPVPVVTPVEKRDGHLISRVFGNIHIEHPEVTRELVRRRLQKRRETEAADAANRR